MHYHWAHIGEYARGVNRNVPATDPEDPEASTVLISSGIHMFRGSDLKPLASITAAPASDSSSTTTGRDRSPNATGTLPENQSWRFAAPYALPLNI